MKRRPNDEQKKAKVGATNRGEYWTMPKPATAGRDEATQQQTQVKELGGTSKTQGLYESPGFHCRTRSPKAYILCLLQLILESRFRKTRPTAGGWMHISGSISSARFGLLNKCSIVLASSFIIVQSLECFSTVVAISSPRRLRLPRMEFSTKSSPWRLQSFGQA